MVICGLNFSFKVQFLRVYRRRNWRFFSAGPFFFVLLMIVYRSTLIPRKLPCPKTFLVTTLQQRLLLILCVFFLFLFNFWLFILFNHDRLKCRFSSCRHESFFYLLMLQSKPSTDFQQRVYAEFHLKEAVVCNSHKTDPTSDISLAFSRTLLKMHNRANLRAQ